MLVRYLSLSLLVLCSACAGYQTSLRPGGGVYRVVDCKNMDTIHQCAEKARKFCPAGYTPIAIDDGKNRMKLTVDCGGK